VGRPQYIPASVGLSVRVAISVTIGTLGGRLLLVGLEVEVDEQEEIAGEKTTTE